MSFILDALKKSETDRQRQSGPALFEVKIAPPKARFPLWAVAIAVLLGVNMMIGGWLLWRRPPHTEPSTSGSASSPAVAETAGTPSIVPPAGSSAAPPASTPSPAPRAPAGAPVASGAFDGAVVAQGGQSEPALGMAPGSNTQRVAAPPGGSDSSGAREPTLAGANRGAAGSADEPTNTSSVNPDDYAPATEPGPMPGLAGHVKRGTASGFMLYQDAALVPGANLPQLRLDLHVYAPKPQDRFALINMHKLREGDSLPEGVRVDSITPEGVVMEHNGLKFLLPRD